MSTGLAIFVKTPGLSALKTRLAADIGESQAIRFHTLSAAAVAAVARAAMPDITPYWAVAEHAALEHPHWASLPSLWQGPGDLGTRLDRVCSHLLDRHERVLLIGADAPQIGVDQLKNAVSALDDPQSPFVLGPARDGGFWLFGTRVPVPRDVWCTPQYSAASTANELRRALSSLGAIAELSELSDVDTGGDLQAVSDALDDLAAPLPEQKALRCWLNAQLPTRQCAAVKA